MKSEIVITVLALASFFSWITHIYTCFSESLWGFLIVGAALFPIGILHGFYIWVK